MTIALVLCFFPFIIAAPSLVREKESHTIEVLLTAPGITHNWLFVAKCYLPILVAAMAAILMFVCAESFYQYYFKSGFLLLGVYVLLAMSAATFLGLAISAVVRSTIQAAAASALYFVCLLLFSGFFVALDQSSGAVRLIANCLPLATLDQIIKAWMFGGQLPGASALPLRLLFGQAVVFGAIAWVSYRRVFVNRI
jgi:ABC-type Na+ efflux pump permease subunit